MVIKINFLLVAIAILIFGIISSVYAHTAYYMKGYKIGREDGKTGAGGYADMVVLCVLYQCQTMTSKAGRDHRVH